MSAFRGLIASIACGFVLGVIGLAVWQALPERAVRPLPPAATIVPPAQTQLAVRPLVPAVPQPTLPPPPPAALPPTKPETLAPAKSDTTQPAWLRYAVAPPLAVRGRARIAIVIDDLGMDRRRTERTIALKGPLTLSFLAYADDLPHLTEAARRAGHELLVHVPMEPMSRAEDMGPNGLAVALSHDELLRRLRWDLGRFEGYVGINNHMGSRFTSDTPAMTAIMAELKARGLLFIDSRTIASTVAAEVAQRLGVPNASRDVFLDNESDATAVGERLAVLEATARRHGSAIAIGHPHDGTLAELTLWLDKLESKGLVLVPVSTIVKERWAAEARG
jgi:polysaccharide deacetylase 2 family uncharacterized protein YibQ